eukprot:CAMPEP_0197181276 /NCGR_PEP_ID=MMETSP1423-20130617/5614_1 /TAXON_ID=476441 /ORGANISM="Pseudo-nitzschia heimii, Strain UNC1101" /LENGTH=312 /DNA_ID=CAMNT_0042631503 /DNA_START=371 /DNA_END=1309 /DNA_ORIENTATION=+
MASKAATSVVPSPKVKQFYKLLEKSRLSHDSFLLRYGLPEGRTFLGIDPALPTCIKVNYKPAVEEHKALSKSYSPVSHPNQEGYFDLIVKSYPYHEGGGVGKYLCDMDVGSSISAQLKGERVMHGSSAVLDRGWKHVGLVAGGTGIAPLLQIARILLEGGGGSKPSVHLLFVNHSREDILGREAIEALAKVHPENFFVTYSFTREGQGECKNDTGSGGEAECSLDDQDDSDSPARFAVGRGDADLARVALPAPSASNDTMVLVCGRDGFVAHWAGPVGRAPTEDGSKGPKIQGPLLGVLADTGFTADQVFKY